MAKGEPRWQLAKLRKLRGLTQAKLAAKVHVATQAVSRWETGHSEVALENIQPLANALEVTVDRLHKVLLNEDEELSGEAANNGSDDLAKLIPEWLSVYTAMEQSSSMIDAFEPHVISGLLQTRDYAQVLIRLSDYARQDESRVKRLVDLRMSRRSALSYEDNPLQLNVIHSEAALRTVVGDREVMRAQLSHLLAMGKRPNVGIRVLPFSAGPHTASYGPFSLLSTRWDGDARHAYTESYVTEGSYLKTQHHIEHFMSLWGNLSRIAASPDDSLEMIRSIREEYE